MKLATIGFTQKSAETFFGLLEQHNVGRIVDIRLHPDGQLAGFAKGRDLAYLLQRLNGCEYVHRLDLAPTEDILGDYRRDKDWDRYTARFQSLMEERDVPSSLPAELFLGKRACLLCSEPTPEKCHRRLVAELLAARWPELDVVHLT